MGQRTVEDLAQRLDWLVRHLLQQSPRSMLGRQKQTLAEYRARLTGAVKSGLADSRASLQHLDSRLYRQSPALDIEKMTSRAQHANDALRARMTQLLENRRHRLGLGARALDTVSPLATLDRGYAIVSDAGTGKVLTNASAAGERIEARLATGSLRATVDEVIDDDT